MVTSEKSNEIVVFVSSTTKDLALYRTRAENIIDNLAEEFKHELVIKKSSMWTEPQSGQLRDAEKASLDWVRKSNWYVIIFGWHYGHIPPSTEEAPNPNQYSVTELEFREAEKRDKSKYPCFVFVAGEKDDGTRRHTETPGLDDNLISWITEDENNKNLNKIFEFRSKLRSKECNIFKSLAHFEKELEGSLRSQINIHRLGPIGPIIDPVRPAVMRCIQSVKKLAQLKSNHDSLHKIRQLGIKEWKNQILNLWREGEPPPAEAEVIFLNKRTKIAEWVGELRGFYRTLDTDDERAPFHQLQNVVHHFDQPGAGVEDGRKKFATSIYRFAKRVEDAFVDANWKMLAAAEELSGLHQKMIAKGRELSATGRLKPEDRRVLEDGMNESISLHDDLQTTLKHHGEWQRLHDQLVRIDADLDSGETSAMALASVQDMLAPVRILIDRASSLWRAPEIPPPAAAGLFGLLDSACGRLVSAFEARTAVEVKEYLSFRNHFDNLFFAVDLRTLEIVKKSKSRAVALEIELNRLKDAEK
jgi:hypothetical protein